MVAGIRKSLRVVNLPGWAIIAAPACILAVWLCEWSLRFFVIWMARLTAPSLSASELFVPKSLPIHQAAVLFLTLAYSLHRGAGFHPVINKRYGTWLAQTPWRYPTPLPMGPAHLVWQDVAIMATLMIFSLLPPNGNFNLLYIPVMFFVAYCLCFAKAFFQLEIYWWIVAFVLLAGIGIMVVLSPWWCLLPSAAMYGITYLGMIGSLRDFPFTEPRRVALGLVAFEPRAPLDVALPIAPMSDDNWLFRLGTYRAGIIGLLAGVVFFAIAYHCRELPRADRDLLLIHTLIAALAVTVRVIAYIGGHRSPISVFGRIATRRLTIPGYDKVFVGPLVAIVAAVVLPQLFMWLGMVAIVAIPLSTAISVSLAFSLPPSFRQWTFTGHYRVPAIRRIGQNFVES